MKITKIEPIIRKYRNYQITKSTPDLLRTIYVDRNGSLSKLSDSFGKNNVDAQIYLNHIRELGSDSWEITKEGMDTISAFYKKNNLFQLLKSIIFGIMAKPFQ